MTFAELTEKALTRYTQAQLAILLKCSQQTVSDYKTGRTVPGLKHAHEIGMAYGVSSRTVISAMKESWLQREA